MQTHYDALNKNTANHIPLSPLSFLKRTADIFSDRTAVIYGERQYTWAQTSERVRRLASALQQRGIGKGDTVSILATNTPEMFEAHYGVPLSGAVLNTINYRLEPDTIAYILSHADTKVLLTDTAFSKTVTSALKQVDHDILVIDIQDCQAPETPAGQAPGECLGEMDYEAFISTGDAEFGWRLPDDEWDALALNYTSGTSGRPKGVVYHHRGAYLMCLGTIPAWQLPQHPVYLYTVPMFHCNGWGHAWTMTSLGGTIVCCRVVSAAFVFDSIDAHGVTHLGGAPIVLSMLVNAPENERKTLQQAVNIMTAGAPPPPAILEQTRALGFKVMQVYGLTETYGHVTHCLWREEWEALDFSEQAEHQSWQGVALPITEETAIVDLDTREKLPRDGQTQGEIAIRGNTVMKGYYKNPEETVAAFEGGWFLSGDAAVWHENGYIQIRDRLKDVIISGGENVSSVEVEAVFYKHPAVAAAAIIAMPDEKWGEVPCAFLELKADSSLEESEAIAFCREHLAGFKTPKKVVFGELPKTATGKIQKFLLRDQIRSEQ